ncbi:serine protease SP24D-like [Anastrepha obliqua]|uniref:serine protease SP24D-like n=1 Tax=Anastrepha obliqua TaxID=95512 RepID=UPI002409E545|nr:serine protease SP24D-like [Anastrepha obliqua]
MEIKNFPLVICIIAAVAATGCNAATNGTTVAVPFLSSQGRIYGGQDAAEGQFPYQVLVTRNGDGYIVVCGGAIISRNYVVTAAHCVSGYSASNFSVRAGTVTFNSGGVVTPVAEVKIHPEYSSFNYDIALLRLNQSLDFTDEIKPILLASVEVPENSSVIITGWGGVSSGGLATTLQYNTVLALNHDTCVKHMTTLADSMRCLGKSVGNGICGGDSGGPAACNGVIIGVASFGVNGCGSSIPDGFTNIVVTRDWIRANSDVDCTCAS